MRGYLWQNLHSEIEEEFERLSEPRVLPRALEFFEVVDGTPQLVGHLSITGALDAREFWIDRQDAREDRLAIEWLRATLPARTLRDRAAELHAKWLQGICVGSLACAEPAVAGSRLCHEHLAAARLRDLNFRRRRGAQQKKRVADSATVEKRRVANERARAGVCKLCASPRVVGKLLCEAHLVEQKQKRKEANAAALVRLRARRKAEGRCPFCETVTGGALCAVHRQRDEAAKAKRRGMREKLEDIREGITHHFSVLALVNGEVEEIDGYIQTGCYADGRLGEVFLKVGRAGDMFAMLDQWAIAFSIALQYGAPLEDLCRKFIGARFEPQGATRNPDIPRCTSLVDYAARWLLQKYGNAQ
jgi:hypothetical protein